MNEKLKPCPFCGGEAMLKTEFTSCFLICCECTICHTRTEKYAADLKRKDALEKIEECKNLAIKDWNRRVANER